MCKRCVLISKRSDFQYGTNFELEERQNPPALTKGCVTGASQDHLVGFHKLTISTGQGNIRKLLNISHNSEAELTVWSPKTCWLFPAPVIFVAIGLAGCHRLTFKSWTNFFLEAWIIADKLGNKTLLIAPFHFGQK